MTLSLGNVSEAMKGAENSVVIAWPDQGKRSSEPTEITDGGNLIPTNAVCQQKTSEHWRVSTRSFVSVLLS